MGATPLFPLFVALFFLGIAGLIQNHTQANRHVTTAGQENTLQAGIFLSYRQAVTAYLVGHSGYVATVPSTYLNEQGISGTVQAQIGHMVVVSATGRQLLVFAPQTNGFEVFRLADNDAAIGRVNNGQFVPYILGGMASALPVALPEGYVVSFVEIGI